MAQTKAPTLTDFTHDEQCEGAVCWCAVREVQWVGREALAVLTGDVHLDSPRAVAYLARKRALLDYIEAQR